ncbi:hypothetical protein EDD76_107109 [Kineothrix alysoides]|jgi:hypothetical protein|uniref:Uncharacterized protein n=1 Tax=Kineothrix alysoides TaxID=1469948 RepID=A0A4R1QYB8_9FIRM|nr:hypothetical protein EDD76_107109 [Kineothrix alysoides]
MKKVQIISLIIFIATLLIMGINIFFTPLSDWIIRINGTIMLINIGVISYSTMKNFKMNK